MRTALRHRAVSTAAASLALTCGVLAAGAPFAAAPADVLQRQFERAARESRVPVRVLLAVAYQMSRWEGHDGRYSADGGYGPMDLTDATAAMAGGDDDKPAGPARAAAAAADPALHTLRVAARLTGIAPGRLRTREADNLRGGAALLASEERRLTGGTPADPAAWYGAVARYSRSADPVVARRFADEVFALLASGAARTTGSGQRVRLDPGPVRPPGAAAAVPAPVPPVPPPAADPGPAQCPPGVRCTVAAAHPHGFQRAARPLDGLAVRYIVIHDTEGRYGPSVREFRRPGNGTAAHYVMRASDGAVTQMVPDQDVAFHAGNYWFNLHSVGIEHEGFAASGATWFTEAQYRATAGLVRYLAARYGVPLDREHVIGHDDVPGISSPTVSGMHWDPGPYWDWDHFMALLGAAPRSSGGGPPAAGDVVAIAPRFGDNRPPVRVCGQPFGDARDREHRCRVLREPASVLYVRTAPSADAPLFGDPALHGLGHGRDVISDWGSTVSAGQRFVVAGRHGDWTAVWFAGAKVWFADPHGVNTAPAPGSVVLTPAGPGAAPVYGQGYPARREYPHGVPPSDHAALRQYRVPAGQAYVATAGPVAADDFAARTGVVVTGRSRYWTVQFGHRLALLDAADVSSRVPAADQTPTRPAGTPPRGPSVLPSLSSGPWPPAPGPASVPWSGSGARARVTRSAALWPFWKDGSNSSHRSAS